MSYRNYLGFFAVIVLSACGCSAGSSVKGVVKLDGNPIEGATVAFVSADNRGYHRAAGLVKGVVAGQGLRRGGGVEVAVRPSRRVASRRSCSR